MRDDHTNGFDGTDRATLDCVPAVPTAVSDDERFVLRDEPRTRKAQDRATFPIAEPQRWPR